MTSSTNFHTIYFESYPNLPVCIANSALNISKYMTLNKSTGKHGNASPTQMEFQVRMTTWNNQLFCIEVLWVHYFATGTYHVQKVCVWVLDWNTPIHRFDDRLSKPCAHEFFFLKIIRRETLSRSKMNDLKANFVSKFVCSACALRNWFALMKAFQFPINSK